MVEEETGVSFAELTDDQLKAYIETGEPFDKAGGYGIQAMCVLRMIKNVRDAAGKFMQDKIQKDPKIAMLLYICFSLYFVCPFVGTVSLPILKTTISHLLVSGDWLLAGHRHSRELSKCQ